MGAGAFQVEHHHVWSDDSGHFEEFEYDGGDIQPYEADSEGVFETDHEGVGGEPDVAGGVS